MDYRERRYYLVRLNDGLSPFWWVKGHDNNGMRYNSYLSASCEISAADFPWRAEETLQALVS